MFFAQKQEKQQRLTMKLTKNARRTQRFLNNLIEVILAVVPKVCKFI